MDVTIVIVSYNVSELLEECLASIEKETFCDHEIIVVDNHSSDGSAEIAKAIHPEIALINNPTNVGFARANNQAFRRARGRYVFMLNPDTRILGSAIDKLVRFMDAHPEAGASGPKNLNSDLSLQYNCHHFPSVSTVLMEFLQLRRFFPKSRLFGRAQMTYWTYDEIRPVDYITGCSLMIRREVLERLGYLDERFFMYSEETDFCFRLKRNNLKTLFYPGASIVHYGGQSSLAQNFHRVHSRTITRHEFESRYYFFRKNYGRGREFILRILDILYFSLSLLKNGFLFFKKGRQERIAEAHIALGLAIGFFDLPTVR